MKCALELVLACLIILGFTFEAAAQNFTVSDRKARTDLAQKTMDSTLRLFGGQESGSCFLVQRSRGKNTEFILVTAAHVFENFDSDFCSMVMRLKSVAPTQVPGADRVRKEFKIRLKEDGNPIWRKHPQADVAVMKLNLPDKMAFHAFQMDNIANRETLVTGRINVGQRCFVVGYPAKLESPGSGFGILRQGVVASYPLGPVSERPNFFLDYQSFGGDSGGPVVSLVEGDDSKLKPMVIGLVFAHQRQTDRTTSPFEERIQHTPIGLGIVAHSQRIHEAIKLLDQ